MDDILTGDILTNAPYTGTKEVEPGTTDSQGAPIYPYIPSEDLVTIVNLAIGLKRPLLIKGEPGCGKTRLAQAVAYELRKHKDYYEPWYVKSTSRARDGLYTYNALGRLRDAQLAAHPDLFPDEVTRSKNIDSYITRGALGKAFEKDARCVVLIDEIDKADIDFPNDLLLELDEERFVIEELDESVPAKHSPIVIITSNDEKDLPDAFLRRCLFHYIEFPTENELRAIILKRFPSEHDLSDLIDTALTRFIELRKEMINGHAAKKVSTSELLDWFKVLMNFYIKDPKGVLDKLLHEVLYAGVLLKSWDDYQHYTKLLKKEAAQQGEDKKVENPPA